MSDRLQNALVTLFVFVCATASATTATAQAATQGKSAREAFELFSVATSVTAVSPEEVPKLISGLTLREASSNFRLLALTAADGSLELAISTFPPEAQYTASFTSPRPYARIPDPLLSWILQRGREVRLDTLVGDQFEITLPETALEGKGASAGIRGRQVKRVRVSVAGEYLGTSTINIWPIRTP